MFPGLEVAYLAVDTTDVDALGAFWSDVVGLVPGATTADGAATWRCDDKAHRLLVYAGDTNDVRALGLEATDDAAFDRAVARLGDAGFPRRDASDVDLAARRVDRLVRFDTPWVVPIEIVRNLAPAAEPLRSDLVPGGFLTDGVGFGHVVFAATDLDASHRFLVDGLGFGQSDWIEMEIADDITVQVRFYHCNRRHHSVAIAGLPFEPPQRLHHVMLETLRRDDVGTAFDRAWATELPIPNGLGRHDNDGMFSFYVQSPAGFQVEIGHGARTVTPDWDDNRAYDRASAWGHQPLRA